MFESTRATPPRVPVEERLFSLVLALLASEQGLTKAEILSTVQGYRQRFVRGGDNTSLERQFERDKDDVRELGIPLETVEPPGESGNNQLLRYRIPKGEYDLPAEVTFSPAEIGVLSLAGTVWREGSLSDESQRALHKLRALGVESSDPLIGYAPRLRTRESAFAPLNTAMDRRLEVTFDYLKPGDEHARRRRVAPLALVQHEGRWHVHGIDRDAEGPRTFLLSRILGAVTTTRRSFTEDNAGSADRALADLRALYESQCALLDVRPDTEAARRLLTRALDRDDAPLRVHYTDVNVFADELAGYGPEVLVREPAALRDAVIERLRRTLRNHTAQAVSDRSEGESR
ncbi:proteasome accessory factor B [Mycetocola sp. BIGb0189]|uniref:helix-turn-helix transcriptional regulator n=1 Tax=Mycetocola sp. BIGb0189 TaxID=2940604 RepID=UPI002169DDD7|nr:WYL domain-containing protein [Mycetocola sp. BIGb0189]MCS4277063.1 proteasome accessory factor B [Mycetocola sp. BIGb0189]